jgi:hypothetical protein
MLSLFKVDVTQIDGHEDWLSDLPKIVPIAEDTPPSWQLDPFNSSIVAGIVRPLSAAENINAIEMTSQKAILSEVRVLRACMCRVALGKSHLQNAPPFAVFLPRFNLLRFETGVGVEKRCGKISPESLATEIASMQLIPWCVLGLFREGQPRIVTSLERISVFRFERYLVRYE